MSNNAQVESSARSTLKESSKDKKPFGVVVGAGSTGLIAASLMATDYEHILIFESSSQFGGVTKDIEGPGQRTFYSGCQYLLLDYLPADYDFSNLLTFEHRYGSITKVDDNLLFKNDFSGPTFPDSWFELDKVVEKDAIDFENLSLRSRVSLYPPQIQNLLIGFISRVFPDETLDQFSSCSAASLGISRVTALQDEMDLVQKKSQSFVWDQLYGVPRSSLGIKFETAAVPKFGFSTFWGEFFEQIYSKTKISLELGVKVNRVDTMEDDRMVSASAKIWTADPRFPVRHFARSRLESKTNNKYVTGIFIIDYEGPSVPYYINVFSKEGIITRIYIYELQDELKITLESVAPFKSIKEVRDEITPLLESAQIRVFLPNQDVRSHFLRQYFPMSMRDTILINKAEEEMSNLGWSKSGMHLSDRSSRIRIIKDSLAVF